MNVFVEGYGCSMNVSDTERIKGAFQSHDFHFSSIEDADFILINTCAVKNPTEIRMLRRIKEFQEKKKDSAKIIVFGCLPKINAKKIEEISSEILLCGPNLEELCEKMNWFSTDFFGYKPVPFNENIAIIPISRGCYGNCSFCATKFARGLLKSVPIEKIKTEFVEALKRSKEIWLTANDISCYGFDIKTNLPNLLKELLKVKGDYRIRIGMGNPNYFMKIKEELVEVMKDERLYSFLHIPIQAGSNKVLREMNRGYKVEDFYKLVDYFYEKIPNLCLSTDIIVGFPGENNEEFNETIKLLKKVKPDVINISKFGKRPGTKANEMNQTDNKTIKERSVIVSKLALEIIAKKNKLYENNNEKIFVSEIGLTGNYVGRMFNYKPVVIKENYFGKFCNVKITKAFKRYLEGKAES